MGDDEFPIKAGDALYVPPRNFIPPIRRKLPWLFVVTGKGSEECEK